MTGIDLRQALGGFPHQFQRFLRLHTQRRCAVGASEAG